MKFNYACPAKLNFYLSLNRMIDGYLIDYAVCLILCFISFLSQRWLTIRHFVLIISILTIRHFVWIISILTIRHFVWIISILTIRHFVWIISILTIRHFYWAFCLVLRIFCSDHFVSISYLVFWPFCVYVSDLRIISAHLEYLLGTYHSDHLLVPSIA